MIDFSDLIYGYDKKVPTEKGFKRYINFDNAASTPPFKSVMELLCREAQWYSGVHRGTGYKSKYSTQKYEEARENVARFAGADPAHDVVIFTKNTTDAINKLSHYLPNLSGESVVYTRIEHHSNELPWLKYPSFCVGLKNGEIDFEQLENFLFYHRGKVKLLAVSGASNITGYSPPIHSLAVLAHQAGARILVDAAQLIPHRPVCMLAADDPRHIDFLAFSGHKIYAPLGVGVLIGPRMIFKGPPSQMGGGTLKGIGPSGIIWSEPPEIEEAGSPNVLGALAVAESCRILPGLGWENLMRHEERLLTYALKKMGEIPRLTVYRKNPAHQVGVISFNVEGVHHLEVAKYLSEAKGIGVRSGCFCARGYVQSLLNLNNGEIQAIQEQIITQKDPLSPGMVRISFGCYNCLSEIDVFLKALHEFCEKHV